LINNQNVIKNLGGAQSKFDRKLWGLLSLELWQQEFHDKADRFRQMMKSGGEQFRQAQEASSAGRS
jgi:asparagine synthase (glutamine-hydrolysing)